eukprot:CAMPEP_0172511772 /NCGR_PEP_ID=MMETSP1066-20121228/238856_1 /TAXON_ID=671091 /ORGANISM="Coscinodiscus wailesii, Strain CCMP2513" /LENGTH=543 /DNA_ID=CAMNT_0013291295 /DNA_START=185 /DNA_END=1816 /DNA_ORIENTATION=+
MPVDFTEGALTYLPGGDITLESLTTPTDISKRHTKVVCTLGPKCWDEETIEGMIEAGMTMARICCSHGNMEEWTTCLERVRKVSAKKGVNVAVMMETTGPEIRMGYFEDNAPQISLTRGEFLTVTTDFSFLGDKSKIAINYPSLPETVDSGTTILLAGGTCVLTVLSVDAPAGEVKCRVENAAVVEPYQIVNIPGVAIKEVASVTAKDRTDMESFAVGKGCDFIALSGVHRADDVRVARRLINATGGGDIKIIAKIDTRAGLNNVRSILEVSDGIMVMRGALARELAPEKVMLVQRFIFVECRIAGKPCVAATEFLLSMMDSPVPCRQECTDAEMAIADGADCVALGRETALGDYPVEAVRTLVRLVSEAETAMQYATMYTAIRNTTLMRYEKLSGPESIAHSAVRTSHDIGGKFILVLTESGSTARQIAKYCPIVPIIVLTPSITVARQCFGLFRGVYAFKVDDLEDVNKLIRDTVEEVALKGVAKEGDAFVVVCGGSKFQRGSTNQVRVEVIQSHYWDDEGVVVSSAQAIGRDASTGCVIS